MKTSLAILVSVIAVTTSGCGCGGGGGGSSPNVPRTPTREDANVDFSAPVKVSTGTYNSSQGQPEVAVNQNNLIVVGWTDRRMDFTGPERVRVFGTAATSVAGPYDRPISTPGEQQVSLKVDDQGRFHAVSATTTGLEYARLSANGAVDITRSIYNSSGIDRPLMAIRGTTIAIVWNRQIVSGGTLIRIDPMLSVSTDGGWSFRTSVMDAPETFVAPSGIAYSSDGYLYVAFYVPTFSGSPSITTITSARAYVKRSGSNGFTFGSKTDLPVEADIARRSGIPSANRNESAVLVNAPILGVTPQGTVLATWLHPGGNDIDIVCSRSTNGGSSFSNPILINDDTTNAFRVAPAMRIDGNGRAHFIWADSRGYYSSGNTISEARYRPMYAISRDACVTASFNVELRSTASRIMTKGGQSPSEYIDRWVGENFGLYARGNEVLPVWSDTTSGHAEVYLSRGVVRR